MKISNYLSLKIGVLVILSEVIALIFTGLFYISRFSNEIDIRAKSQINIPGNLMSKGALNYEIIQDKATIENLIGVGVSESYIIGLNGKIYYSLNEDEYGKTISEVTSLKQHTELSEKLSDPIIKFSNYKNQKFMISIYPLTLEDGKLIGYLFIKALTNNIVEAKSRITFTFILGSLLCIIITSIVIIYGVRIFVTNKIKVVLSMLEKLKNGDLLENENNTDSHDKVIEGHDEIGQMFAVLNKLINRLKTLSNFSVEIGKGKFESELESLSEKDLLGNSLINMREELKKAAVEEEKRRLEDEKRNWVTQGIAKFGDILRQNNDNMEELSYNVISELVQYLEANQGGLFLINNNNEDDLFIELIACHAYDRRKFLKKRIEMKEGLAGRCVQEKGSIYLTEIPEDYIYITSGLGGSNPRSLLLVPMLLNEEIFGVIEIASFKFFEDYQIDFVEKIGESIASTFSGVRINFKTTLLLEQTKQQTEEMQAQEEEMRQNLEELIATQEQSARREEELKKALHELKEKKRKNK